MKNVLFNIYTCTIKHRLVTLNVYILLNHEILEILMLSTVDSRFKNHWMRSQPFSNTYDASPCSFQRPSKNPNLDLATFLRTQTNCALYSTFSGNLKRLPKQTFLFFNPFRCWLAPPPPPQKSMRSNCYTVF